MNVMATRTGSRVVAPPAARTESLHHLVEGWAARTPEAVALVSGETRLGYRELDARANRLAHYLRALGVGPEVRVAISLERGPQVVVAVLAVLKAGGAWVPLDPSYPAERLAYMLADSAAPLLLTRAGLAPGFPAGPWRVVLLDEAEDEAARLPATSHGVAVEAASLAYLIYTSGSTGRPKGVMVAHGGLAALARAQAALLAVGPESRVLQFAPTSFDASVAEMGQAFAAGACLVLAGQEELLPGPGFAALLRERGVTHVTLPPSVLAALPPAELPALGVLAVAGEACGAALVERWGKGRRFVNAYGPTEATVCVTMGDCAAGEAVTIGRALPGVRAYVVAEGGRRAAPGEAGELCAGGGGVARGYHGRPAATAERFIPDPFAGEPGARMYRTGDLARAREDGRLEYLGRIDRQVKVRGQRVELDEVEGVLLSHPGVAAGTVAAYEAADGLLTLAAHVVPGPAAPTDAELRAWLAERLPPFMLPSNFVRHAALPLSPGGKVDRARLPRPEPSTSPEGTPPRTATERALARIWGEVLGMASVPADRPFLELGGHSLRAMSVLARVAEAFGVELPPHVLLRSGSVEAVAALLDAADGGRAAGVPAPERAPRDGVIPVSVAQEATWFFEQLAPGQMAYRAQALLRLRGALDVRALERSLTEIVRRHEIFRTTFPVEDGAPVQRIHAPWRVALPVRQVADEAELAERVREEFMRPLDAARLPLVRWSLLRRSPGEHVLLMVEHHFVHDGWSFGVFLHELRALYLASLRGEDSPLPEPGLQFADYAAWQRRWVESEAAEAKLGFWERRLAGVPVLELPTDFPRPPAIRFRGAAERVRLSPALAAEARAFSREHGVTLFVTLLATYQALLSRYSGQRDFCVGSAVGNRGHRAFEGVIGMIVNTVALRADLDGHLTVREHLRRVRETTLEAWAHEDVPFERVVRRLQPERGTGTLPICQVLFSFHNAPMPELSFGGVEMEVEEAQGNGSAKFDLQVVVIPRAEQGVAEKADEVVMVWEYSTDLYARDTVLRMVDHFHTLLAGLVRNPDRPVEALPLLGQAERHQVVEEWNRTEAEVPADRCIHELFQAQAARTPDAMAVSFEGERLTYAELNARANRLAHHLRGHGVGPEVRVGVLMERSLEMVVSLLAVLKAGGAYVPLDPGLPAERLAYMLDDSGVAVLLTQERLRGILPASEVPALEVDAAWDSVARESAENLAPAVTPSNVAYVIYTSGSTGRPKGVMNAHRGVVNRLVWMQAQFGLGADDVVLQKTPFGFDVSVWEFFWPLQQGARLVMARPDGHRDPAYLRDVVEREGVTTLHFVPSMLQPFVEAVEAGRCGSLRHVVCSGEALPPALVRRFYDRFAGPVVLTNLYGPTEAAVDVSCWTCPRDTAAGVVPIGRPVWNTRLYVLDAALEPLPVGVPGELYIGGVQVARGYQGHSAMTAERFVPDPFSTEGGARLYRTGDRARWREESAEVRECVSAEVGSGSADSRTNALTHSRTGVLEYLGRLDFQVKVRGFRIELGEIEAALRPAPGVRDCTVVVREDETGDRQLVAYVVGEAEAEALRDRLRQSLPEYMLPAAFVALDALPLTANGKLDRKALPAPEGDAYARRSYEVPLGEVETALAEIWGEALGVERVGRWDHFFKLGGHSLMAIRLIERMRRAGLYTDVRVLFTTPVLAELALAVGRASSEVEIPANGIPEGCASITPEMLPLAELTQAEIDRIVAGVPGGAANVQDIYPLAPLQEGVLFHYLLSEEGDPYLMSSVAEFDTRARLDQYLAALQAVIDRHDILRTALAWDGLREPVQVVWRHAPLPVDEVELDAEAGDAAEQLWRRYDPRHYRMDLGQAPLRRACIAEDRASGRWLLLMLMHHLTNDHESLEVLREEISAHLRGRGSELPAPLPFRDYVARARLGVSREEHERFFRGMLGDIDEPTAPYGLLDVWGEGHGIGEARLPVAHDLGARLRRRARALGVSAASLCHLAWAQVLARLSGRADVVFGTLLFGRMQGGEGADRVMGPFINTLPVRIGVGEEGAEAAVRRTHALLADLLRHEHASLSLAQRSSGVAAPAPLFTSLLNYRYSGGTMRSQAQQGGAPGEGVRGLRAQERTNYPVTLSVDDRGEEFSLVAQVAAPAQAERVCRMMHTALERLVEALEVAPGRAIGSLDVLPEAERRIVVEEWNRTDAEYPTGSCIHELFEAQAARTPDAVAVRFEQESLTYATLDHAANRLANHLRRRGVHPETRVGICLPRTPELVAAMLGVLKAGGAYVPLDPAYPRERLGYMLEDAGVTLVITESALADRLPENAAGLLLLDVERDAIAAESAAAPESGVLPENLSHVIFTSGSTGRPKGVMIRHASTVVLLHWLRENVTDEERSSVLFSTSINFDVSIAEVFGTLAWGGKLVMVENALELAALGEEVVYASMVPSAAAELLRSGGIPASVRTLNLGGEALPNALAQGLYALGTVEKVGNLYGPTEDTTYSTYHLVPRGADQVLVGTPVANTRAYVLDAHLQPVPMGVAGELYLSGDGLSRGYANRPAMTAERFVPCPFGAPGGRMYRVMDRVRWRESASVRECVSAGVGDSREAANEQRDQPPFTPALPYSRTAVLEFLGRTDFQVKVRGYRIELGEIEARLAEHPGVRAPVVLVREDAPGDRRLVAYYLADEPVAGDVLKSHLAERLPEYMVPAAYVWMERLPLTPNGKTDRRALPAPEGDAYAAWEYEAPAGETEQAVAAIWAEVLGAERVGRGDDFFALGGHSLLAVRVVSRVRQALGVEASPRDVFERPVLADFARRLETAARAEATAIARVERSGPLALSFAQQRLWFLAQLGNLGSAYHISMRLRLRGMLDRGALVRSLDRIVARHEALRTTFAEVDGEPVQHIAAAEESGFRLVEHDLRASADAEDELRRLVHDEASATFDLARGPLVRGRLVRMAADDHVLLLTMHHIVSDGWSTGVLFHELTALYAAFTRGEPDPLPPLPVQYADYAAWHRRWVEGPVLEAQAEYWTRTLAGAPELLELPTDHPRPAKQDFAGASVKVELDEALTAALRTLAQRHGTTLFMTLLAGWAVVLSRLSGQDDVVIGTPSANRGRSEIEGLIGFFVNTLPVRVDLSGAPTGAELLRRVRERTLGAQRHQDFPFEQMVERVRPARSLSHTPLFQAMLAWQEVTSGPLELPGIAAAPIDGVDRGAAPFDLMLGLAPRGERIAGTLVYATALFDRATVERYAGYLRRVLEEMAADDRRPADRLALVGEAERARLLALGEGAAPDFPRATVDALFAQTAAASPQAVALAWDGGRMTYAELDERANRLAHHLRRAGVAAGTRVGVCLERGPEMVVATLAALKAGGAYVPLDPAYPAERLAFMLADTAVPVLVTESRLADRLPPHSARIVRVDADAAAIAAESSDSLVAGTDPEAAAYVMYTSGSTGRPKGVEVPHRAIVRLVRGQDYISIDPSDVFLQLAPASFDAATLELWGPLLNGARLAIHPAGQTSVESVGRALAEHGVTVFWLTTPLFHLVVEERIDILRGVRQLIPGGEVLSVPHARRALAELPETALINSYGPTENTTFTSCHRITRAPVGAGIPIGLPIANTYVRVLDPGMQPVPVGVPGELYVGGAGLALGYLNQPQLTAEKFVADPYLPGARLYRTGDRVRWVESAEVRECVSAGVDTSPADSRTDALTHSRTAVLEFLGRVDAQVKIRGFRIEPGEVEARLLEHGGVREAVVLAREDAPGKKRLVAYVVGEAAADALRAHLAGRLPGYMVPEAYVRLKALPLTSNGKLDRRALPAPDGAAYPRRGHEPPRTTTEQVLAEIWTEVLGVQRVGRRDHFFDLGGNSLLAVRLVSRAREAVNPAATVEDVFAHPTLYGLAARLRGDATWFGTRAIPVRETGSERPLFVVHDAVGIVFYGQMLRPHLDAEIPMYALPGPLSDTDELGSMDDMVTRLVRMMTEVQPEGPYRLVGWSAGGVFAYAVAERLVRTGRAVQFLGLLDTSHPAILSNRDSPRGRQFTVLDLLARDGGMAPATPESLRALKEETEGLDLPAFFAACKARRLLPESVTLARAEQVESRIALLKRSNAEYVPGPLPFPVHLFTCEEADAKGDPSLGWQCMPGGAPFRLVRVPGMHHTMWRKGNVEVVGAALSRAIRASAEGGG
jgi:amino acid adenylation domain-containing protein